MQSPVMKDFWISKKIDLKITEAKHLNEKINSYCTINIDGSDTMQTATVPTSDNPAWEYKNSLEKSSEFDIMKINVWNQQHLGDKKKYGEVMISKRELTAGVSGWYSIQPVKPKCQGKILVQFKYYRPKGNNPNHSVSVTIMKAEGLNNGYSDVPPTTQAVLHLIPNLISHATAIKEKNANPEFLEYFTFTFKEILDVTKIYISLWDPVAFATNTVESSLGFVSVPVKDLIEKGPTYQTWLDLETFHNLSLAASDASSTIISSIRNEEKQQYLSSKPPYHNFKKSNVKNIICPGCKSKISKSAITCTDCLITAHQSCGKACRDCPGLGMIYIEAKYEEHTILPLPMYDSLIEFLFQDKFALPMYLEKLKEERDETLEIMLTLMDSKGRTTDFLQSLLLEDLRNTNETQTLFRSNTFATKNVDMYMKRHGKLFMKKVLESMMIFIRKPDVNCELDPDKLQRKEALENNKANLERCCGIFLGDLLKNIHLIPLEIFLFVRTTVVEKFGGSQKTGYASIGGFLFLRFFGPALLSPQRYGLIEGNLNPQTRRNLLLVSKTLQNLSNFVKFGVKEPYMKVMNDFLENSRDNLELIMDLISNPETRVPKFIVRTNALETAKDADRFSQILMKSHRARNFLNEFDRKTDVLLLLGSIERKKDVIRAKLESGKISPISPHTLDDKITSNTPPPRNSSANWRMSGNFNTISEIPEDKNDDKSNDFESKDDDKSTLRGSKIEIHKRESRRSSRLSKNSFTFEDKTDNRPNSFRISTISSVSINSVSDLEEDADARRRSSIFGTFRRALGRKSTVMGNK